jgi:phage terminase large subunit-like protein
VDYNDITQWFVDMVKTHDIRPLWICYDAALSGYWAPQMTEIGFNMEKIRQGPFTWTYPMKLLQGAFEEHRVIYQNNPMLRWCLLNTAKKSTNKEGIESIQPVKSASNRRIDGMVSLLNAWTGLQNHSEEFIPYLR